MKSSFSQDLIQTCLLATALGLPAVAQAQFNYTINNGAITFTRYTGSGGAVNIPATINGLPVTSIGDYAFNSASLTSVTIPGSVTNIGNNEFNYCCSLTAIIVDAANPAYCSLDGVLFDKSRVTLIQFPEAKAGNYAIPDSVTSIGSQAFANCYSLTSINVDAANLSYSSVNGVLFDKSQTVLIEYPAGLHGSYNIPGGVNTIGDSAFVGCSLTEVTIPSSVTAIGDNAFNGSSLPEVTIPSSVISIGEGAFSYALNLKKVFFAGNAPSFGPSPFFFDLFTTFYYLPGTTGWDATGITVMLWLPLIQTGDAGFGVRSNQFGFNIAWASGQTVVVEACTNLHNPVWFPVATNTLTGDSSYFSDPQWTNYPARFYRLRSP